MSAFINRTGFIGAVLFITAMLFTGSVFAQTTEGVWRIQTWQQEDGGPYDQDAAFCETGTPCIEVGAQVCLNTWCKTTTGNTSNDVFLIPFTSDGSNTHQLCLNDSKWKLVSGSTNAGQVNANCVQKDFDGVGGFDHTTAMYLELATSVAVTKEFSDDSGGTVSVSVSCTGGAIATAQGDGTLANDETQYWLITNISGSTNCRATESPVPAGYTGSKDAGSQGSCDVSGLADGDSGSCTITNTLNTDTIRVYKEFTDGATFNVDVTMNCTSGNVDSTGNTYNTKSVQGGNYVSFNVTGFNQTTDASGQSTTCTITESNFPDDYHQVSAVGCQQTMQHQDNSVDCVFTNGPDRATFIIEKEWNQPGDTDGIPVTGHLSCTGATTTQQNVVFTATTDAILFVYNIFDAQGPVDCTVTEDVPANYRASYDCNGGDCGDSEQDVDACFYPDVEFQGVYRCTITNTPRPAHITVTKTWVIEGADQGFNGYHEVGMVCSDRVRSPWGDQFDYCYQGNCAAYIVQPDATEGSIDYEFTIPKPAYPATRCVVRDFYRDNVIEEDNGCGRLRVKAGDDIECEVVNTVFFEGIPTLNQYGMAILALLMLGVGFVGFRRFI